MNVASLELSKELYELSGWKNLKAGVFEIEKAWRPTPLLSGDNYRLINIGPNTPEDIPAYDLGYLLWKLPREVEYSDGKIPLRLETQWSGGWRAHYGVYDWHSAIADTPENALCRLAMGLFKQGVLPAAPKQTKEE